LNPDLIWFNLGASVFGRSPWANISGLLTPMMARHLGIPTVVTLHELIELTDLRALDAPGGFLAPLGARLLTSIAAQADVLCLTLSQYSDLLSARGVDCMHIPIGAYHEPELLLESDSQELLFFTTLAPFKGLELLLEAFTPLRKEHPNLKLTIAGAEHTRFPDYARELKSRFNETDDVKWLGQVNEEDVKDLYQRAQIVVLPYTASTGSSSVLYQAATWGRAIVASDLNEIRELAVESDLQIQFFKSGNITSLRESLHKMLASADERSRQAARNFKSIQRTRPAETCIKYIQAFNRALEKRRVPKRIEIIQTA
jgi:glycosyltransferase involved in cell wall biosynthesis